MPKRQTQRIIDSRRRNASATIIGATGSGAPVTLSAGDGLVLTGTTLDVVAGDGVSVAADSVAVDSTVVRTTRTVTAGSGLTGGGALSSDLTLNVGAGTLLTVGADSVGITAGSNYQFIGTGSGTAAAWQNLSGLAGSGLTHSAGVLAVGVSGLGLSVAADAVALASNSNPGAAASILATDGDGYLSLVRLTTTDRVRTPLIDTVSGDLALAPATGIATIAALHASTRVRTPLIDTASGNLSLQPASGIVALPSAVAIQSSNYASQATGWRATYAGEGDFRYLFVDEMHAKSFIADLEQALAGGQIISKSVAVLALDFTLPAAGATGTLRVRDLPSAPNMAVFQAGDFVGLRQFSRAAGSLTIGWAWGTVTAYADQSDGTQTWTFTRHASTPGAASGTIAADSLVLDFGVTGNGFYEVNAIDGAYGANSPYWRIVTWSSHPATQTVRVQGGNLRGLFGVADEYGLYAGDGTATSSAYLRMSNQASLLQNVPLSIYTSGVKTIQIDPTDGIDLLAYTGLTPADTIRQITWKKNLADSDAAVGIWGVAAADNSLDAVAVKAARTGVTNNLVQLSAETSSGGTAVIELHGRHASLANSTIVMASVHWQVGADYPFFMATPRVGASYAAGSVMWHAGNDGSGSGLDADTLDAYHASAFALLSGSTFTGNVTIDVPASGSSNRFAVRTTGALATSTNNDTLLIWHIADNEMGIGVVDGTAWRTLVLQPAGGTVDVRGSLIGDNATFSGAVNLSGSSLAAGTYLLDALAGSGAARDVLRAGIYGVTDGLTVRYTTEMEYALNGGIVVATGRVGYDWSELTPGGGWNNYGSGNATFGVKRFGNLVSIKGVLSASGAIASNTSIYTLASEYRPSATRQFVCYGTPGAVRVVIASDGTLRPQSAFSTSDYLSIEITYFTGG